jgi:hypothetical protein
LKKGKGKIETFGTASLTGNTVRAFNATKLNEYSQEHAENFVFNDHKEGQETHLSFVNITRAQLSCQNKSMVKEGRQIHLYTCRKSNGVLRRIRYWHK